MGGAKGTSPRLYSLGEVSLLRSLCTVLMIAGVGTRDSTYRTTRPKPGSAWCVVRTSRFFQAGGEARQHPVRLREGGAQASGVEAEVDGGCS